MPTQAVMAGVAGYMMGDGDSLTFFEEFYPTPHLHNLPANLVPQHQGRPVKAIPFHHVAAADAAGFHPHQ